VQEHTYVYILTVLRYVMEIDFNKPTRERPHSVGNGIQKIWRFKNGYGASIVQFKIGDIWGSYTDNDKEWELAVIKFASESLDSFTLVYDTAITNDVMGHLTGKKVIDLLKRIKEL